MNESDRNEPAGAISRLIGWFHDGPSDDDGTLGWMIAMTIWWRMLLMSGLYIAVLLVAIVSAAVLNPLTAVMVSVFIAYLAGSWSIKLSPKYDVTKNY